MDLYNFTKNPLKFTFPNGLKFVFGPKTYWVGSHKDSQSLVILRDPPTRDNFSDIERYNWLEVVEVSTEKS